MMIKQNVNFIKSIQLKSSIRTYFQNAWPTLESHWNDNLFAPIHSSPALIQDTHHPLKQDKPRDLTEKECFCIIQSPNQEDLENSPQKFSLVSNAPLAMLFGWAGSTHKNLDRYSSLYRKAGFTTMQYILPTRHIFKDTDQIPDVMEQIYSHMISPFLSLSKRPIFLHCMSDTGVLCYEGFHKALQKRGEELDIKGVIWDSCQGPDRWSNLIDGVWCGHFARDLPNSHPELFLYSKTDFCQPCQYLVEKSRNADHLRLQKQEEYINIILDFIHNKCLSKEAHMKRQSMELMGEEVKGSEVENIIVKKVDSK